MKPTLLLAGLVAFATALPAEIKSEVDARAAAKDWTPIAASDIENTSLTPRDLSAINAGYESCKDCEAGFQNCISMARVPGIVETCKAIIKKSSRICLACPDCRGCPDGYYTPKWPKGITEGETAALEARDEIKNTVKFEDDHPVLRLGNPVDFNCEDCHARYHRCVELAFVPGLPACEKVCKKRVKGTAPCNACEDKYYPSYDLVKPAITFERPLHNN